jgi:hypothetical protein
MYKYVVVGLFSTAELYMQVAFTRVIIGINNLYPPVDGGIGSGWLCVWVFHPDKTGFIFLNICSIGLGTLPSKNSCSRF